MMKKIIALLMAFLIISAMTVCAFAADGAEAASYSDYDGGGESYSDYDGGGEINLPQMIVISLVVGLLIGLFVALILRSQLKSVRKRYTAHEYVRPGSTHIRRVGDFYLYRNVVRTRRQNNNK